jgi:hypothetical protein
MEGVLMRCGLTDKQVDQARKVIEQADYESLSNFANTRYGGSMRGSSLDSRGQDGTRRTLVNRNLAAGSDGFTAIS